MKFKRQNTGQEPNEIEARNNDEDTRDMLNRGCEISDIYGYTTQAMSDLIITNFSCKVLRVGKKDDTTDVYMLNEDGPTEPIGLVIKHGKTVTLKVAYLAGGISTLKEIVE